MKNNMIIAFSIIVFALPMFGMHNAALDERMPKMIVKFKKKYDDPRYQIYNMRDQLLAFHRMELLPNKHMYSGNSMPMIEASLGKYVSEANLVNSYFSPIRRYNYVSSADYDNKYILNGRFVQRSNNIA